MKKIFLIVTQLLFVLTIHGQTQQELRDSISMISKLIEQHPRAVNLYLRKAALNIELDQWQYALDEYTKVLDMMPSHLTALYYRGFVNQHLGRYSYARTDYERLLLLEPGNLNGMIGLALTNLSDGRQREAYDLCNRLVEMHPDVANVYSTRAEIEIQRGMKEAALDDMEHAIELERPAAEKKYPITIDDDIASYQLTAFDLYLALGKTNEAKQCLEYLEKNGLSRAYLIDYYRKLKIK